MAEIIKEPIVRKVSNLETTNRIIYFACGLLEVLLSFRLILKLAGASLSSSFVTGLYGITSILILPFDGIFRRGTIQGAAMVFEPGTLIAIAVYAMLAWGIVKLMVVLSGEKQPV